MNAFLTIICFLVCLSLNPILCWGSDEDFEKKTGAVINNPKLLWGETPQESLILPILNQYVVNEVIQIRPITGHHFNLKASNNCNTQKPLKISAQEIQCQFQTAGKYKISTYICDDKNTFCKFQFIHINVTAPRGYKSALRKTVSSNILYIPKAEFQTPPTFIKNKVSYAVAQAQKENKPLYIVFSAHWCPACNMLSENIYPTKEFLDSSKEFVKLIVDVDSDLSWELKDKFKVGAYPTTLIATAQMNEVGRFVGYRSIAAVTKWIRDMKSLESEPIDFVISKVQQLSTSKNSPEFKTEFAAKLLRLGQWHFEREEYKEALNFFKQVETAEGKKRALMTEFSMAQQENKKEQAEAILLNLIKEHSADVALASWLSQYAQSKAATNATPSTSQTASTQKIILQNADKALEWIQNPQLEFTDFSKTDVYYFIADAYESSELKDKAKEYYLKCATEYENLAKLSQLKTPRGAQMEQAFCLTLAGQSQKAIQIFEKLAKEYRTEFAFNFYYAKALQQTGDVKNAIKYVTLAFESAYGDNLIRAATLKSQLELESKDLAKAEKTVTSTLDKVYLPQTQNIRTHKYVAHLRYMLERIQYIKTGQKEGIQ